MGRLRHFLLARRGLVLALVALAIGMKALVPAGFMVETHGRVLTVAICSDASGLPKATREIAVPSKEPRRQGGETGEACPYGALSMAALGAGADPALLLLALAFILLRGFLPVPALRLTSARRIRPPLRAPPVVG